MMSENQSTAKESSSSEPEQQEGDWRTRFSNLILEEGGGDDTKARRCRNPLLRGTVFGNALITLSLICIVVYCFVKIQVYDIHFESAGKDYGHFKNHTALTHNHSHHSPEHIHITDFGKRYFQSSLTAVHSQKTLFPVRIPARLFFLQNCWRSCMHAGVHPEKSDC